MYKTEVTPVVSPQTATLESSHPRRGRIRRELRRATAALTASLILSGCSGIDLSFSSSKKPLTSEQLQAQRIDNQIRQMSVEEEVGQMFVFTMRGTQQNEFTNTIIQKDHAGGIIFFSGNLQTKQQTLALTTGLQQLSEKSSGVPIITAVDQEGGRVERLRWLPHEPAEATIGTTGNTAEAHDIAKQTGEGLKASGINTDLAPVADTGFGSAIGDRSFSANPKVTSVMVPQAVKGYKDAGEICAAKHFPNHGVASIDSHIGLPVVNHDMPTINSYDLPAFKAAIKAGIPIVMMGHLVYPAIDAQNPASLSPNAVKLLRDQGFQGVIITDSLGMTGAKQGRSLAEVAERAVVAGDDMMIMPDLPADELAAYAAVVKEVKAGKISKERIDASTRRILTLKDNYLHATAA